MVIGSCYKAKLPTSTCNIVHILCCQFEYDSIIGSEKLGTNIVYLPVHNMFFKEIYLLQNSVCYLFAPCKHLYKVHHDYQIKNSIKI